MFTKCHSRPCMGICWQTLCRLQQLKLRTGNADLVFWGRQYLSVILSFCSCKCLDVMSVHPSLRPSIYSSVHSFICLNFHPSIHLSIYPSIRLSLYSFVRPSVRPSVRSFVRSFVHHPSIRPSVRSFIHSFIHPSIHLIVRQSISVLLFACVSFF